MTFQEFQFVCKQRGLTQNEYLVFVTRYSLSLTFMKIGSIIDVTPARARQIYFKAKKKLNHPETHVWVKKFRGLL